MWIVETLSDVLRKGNVEDGPPYPQPGNVWVPLTYKGSKIEAEDSLGRILKPMLGQPAPDAKRYRVRQAR